MGFGWGGRVGWLRGWWVGGGVVGGRQTHNLKCHAVGITLSPAPLALWGDKHTSTNERREHRSMADEFCCLRYSADRREKTQQEEHEESRKPDRRRRRHVPSGMPNPSNTKRLLMNS